MNVNEEKIGFIIPFRNREDQIDGCIHTIEKYYENFEIIFACQEDNNSFKRGQLFNLGFKKSSSDILVLMDVDIRFLYYLNICNLVKENNRPLLPFCEIQEISEEPLGKYHSKGEVQHTASKGFCNILTRKEFVESNGFSNLYFGWGAEDGVFNKRVGFQRLNFCGGHIAHLHAKDSRSKLYKNNCLFRTTEKKRDSFKDSFQHTITKELKPVTHGKKVIFYKFYDINVRDDFEYMDLLLKQKDQEMLN